MGLKHWKSASMWQFYLTSCLRMLVKFAVIQYLSTNTMKNMSCEDSHSNEGVLVLMKIIYFGMSWKQNINLLCRFRTENGRGNLHIIREDESKSSKFRWTLPWHKMDWLQFKSQYMLALPFHKEEELSGQCTIIADKPMLLYIFNLNREML